MNDSSEILRLISAARQKLILDFPFFGVLSLRLKIIITKQYSTMATDGVALFVNPDFVTELTKKELLGVIAHEVLHCANKHNMRGNNKDHDLWNKSCDYAINPTILESGLTLPKDALLNKDFSGKSAEEIYYLLLKQPSKKEEKRGGFGEVLQAPEKNKIEVEQEWSFSILQSAKQLQNSCREIPGFVRNLIGEIKAPKGNWKELLQMFVQQTINKDDYTWKIPNKSFSYMGIYLPSMEGKSVDTLVIAIDTSGSINDVLLSSFQNEVNEILENVKPNLLHVIYCDNKIQKHDVYETFFDKIIFTPVGGGGTNFKPVFRLLKDEEIYPSCLLFFTDMYGSFPELEPNYPVIWCDTCGDINAPFGLKVNLN